MVRKMSMILWLVVGLWADFMLITLGWSLYTIWKVDWDTTLDFSVEDFINEMYEGHRYGRDE
tara:strand:+ start:4608 stop:4793 length:186 start_codon:yes stop_codon:yes gene_type:complete